MTPEQINQAIAQKIGRSYHKPTETEIAKGSYYQYEPNYYADLNAVREAEVALPQERKTMYIDYLLSVIHQVDAGYFERISWEDSVDLVLATAPQRCEALLRTWGLWKEVSS